MAGSLPLAARLLENDNRRPTNNTFNSIHTHQTHFPTLLHPAHMNIQEGPSWLTSPATTHFPLPPHTYKASPLALCDLGFELGLRCLGLGLDGLGDVPPHELVRELRPAAPELVDDEVGDHAVDAQG